MSQTRLKISNFSLGISKDKLLVKGIDLEIKSGEIHGLIGESGSGKSLSALSVIGLQPKSLKIFGGSIQINLDAQQIDVTKINDKSLRSIRGKEVGFIFQDPMTSLNPSMKCGHQVLEVLNFHNSKKSSENKKEVLRLFEKVKLPSIEKIYNSYPHEISGGQRQRVMIAMAVACKPKLLIADEITTALDVTVQKSILELIDELRKSENLAVLFITHDLTLISYYADRISIMYHGEIVESGEKQEIIKRPVEQYTKGLLACKPPIDKKLNRLLTLEEVMKGNVDVLSSNQKDVGNDILLEVKNLNTYYTLSKNLFGQVNKEMHALKDISFNLKKGESLALVGESGSGKSTLGRSILHLVESRSGEVFYKGESIYDLNEKQFRKFRKKIQFVFQDPFSSLNPKMSIGRSLSESLKINREDLDKSKIKDETSVLLEKVGLSSEDYNKYPHQFSGGQRQRIVIARALTCNPEFIICDEAVSALDVSVQAVILNLLKDLQEEFDLTYLFITHDMSVVRFFCDRMLVMKDGVVVEEGETEKIFAEAKHVFTKELIESSF